MSESRFYICKKCGNTVGMIHDGGRSLICCNEKMTHLDPTNNEKHPCVVKQTENMLKVVMSKSTDHEVDWVYLSTDRGGQRKSPDPDGSREINFTICDEIPVAVYAYCHDHGITMTKI